MYKNTASQHIQFLALLSTTQAPVTGDAANITAYVSIDGGAVTVLGDTSASELSSTNAKGSYQFDLTQAETNGNTLLFTAKSSTANVVLYPVLLQTFPACFGIAGGAAGGPYIAGSNAAVTDASRTCTGALTLGSLSCTGAALFGNNFTITGNYAVNGTALVGSSLTVGGAIVCDSLSCTNDFSIGGDFDITNFNITANFNVNGLTILNGGVFLLSTLDVTGAVTLASSLTATGAVELGSLQVNGDTDFIGNFNMNADWQVVGGVQFGGSILFQGTTLFQGALTAANAANDIRLGATERTSIGAAIWNFLTTGIVTVGSIGLAIMQRLTGTTGQFHITVTVTDGTNPVQNAEYSVFDGTTLVASGNTDVNGQHTMSYPAGTFTVAIVKPNFLFATVSRTVTGEQTGTLKNNLVMTPISVPTPPISPSKCVVYGYLVDANGAPLAGTTLIATPVPKDAVTKPVVTDTGSIFSFIPEEGVSDGVGYVEVIVVRTDKLSHPVSFTLTSSNGQIARTGVKLTAATLNINVL